MTTTSEHRREILSARAEARAQLWHVGEYELAEAVDPLQAWAVSSGLVNQIGMDAVQAIMAQAFGAVRTDLPKAEPKRTYTTAQSTLDAAAWLWFQVGDRERFGAWMSTHEQDRTAIKAHLRELKAERDAGNERR